jgi:hypothetical protein
MPARLPLPSAQLLLYGIGTDANFEGQLVGALERIESGGTLRDLEALLVQKDRDTGEFAAVAVRGHSIGGFVAPLLGFRLDPTERRRATERALGTRTAGGVSGETIRELADALDPGAAVAAVLVEHLWAGALEDAVARTGGTPLASEFVEATALEQVAPVLLAAAGRHPDAASTAT